MIALNNRTSSFNSITINQLYRLIVSLASLKHAQIHQNKLLLKHGARRSIKLQKYSVVTKQRKQQAGVANLNVPHLNSPVNGRCEKERREVYGTGHCVTVDACHWTLVPFKGFVETRFTAPHTHTCAQYTTNSGRYFSYFLHFSRLN
jgi:hypothetical protein